MTKKTTEATKKRGKRNIKVGKLPKAKKQLSEGELRAVEGSGPLASFASGFARAIEDVAASAAHSVGEIAKKVESGIKG
jgi:hypothetical protein